MTHVSAYVLPPNPLADVLQDLLETGGAAICTACKHLERDCHGRTPGHPVLWKCRPVEDIDYQTGKPIDCDCQAYNPNGKCEFYVEMKGEEGG